MIACPVCRAENAEQTCRRCRADLGLLFDLESRRSTDQVQAQRPAVACLTAGDFPKHFVSLAESSRTSRGRVFESQGPSERVPHPIEDPPLTIDMLSTWRFRSTSPPDFRVFSGTFPANSSRQM